MSDFDLARAIGMSDAARLMRGRKGRPPSVETVRRWANPRRGCPTPAGPVVLRAVKINGELLTMAAWVEEFEAARLAAGRRQDQPPPLRTSAARERARREAAARLDAAGIGAAARRGPPTPGPGRETDAGAADG